MQEPAAELLMPTAAARRPTAGRTDPPSPGRRVGTARVDRDVLRDENAMLTDKLAQLSRVTRALAAELAASRRECNRLQVVVDALRAENRGLEASGL